MALTVTTLHGAEATALEYVSLSCTCSALRKVHVPSRLLCGVVVNRPLLHPSRQCIGAGTCTTRSSPNKTGRDRVTWYFVRLLAVKCLQQGAPVLEGPGSDQSFPCWPIIFGIPTGILMELVMAWKDERHSSAPSKEPDLENIWHKTPFNPDQG